MAKISDIIETMIKEMLEENDGLAEFTRGSLADKVNCVPSQITYVLSTRFTNGQGYRVESRRGGGGYIRIYQIDTGRDKASYIMHTVNALGNRLSQQEADVYIENFLDHDIIDPYTASLLMAATSDSSLDAIPMDLVAEVRMTILKNLLIQILLYNEENL